MSFFAILYKKVQYKLLISNLSQMMVHLFNSWSNDVEVNTKIDVLNEIHVMTLRWRAYDAKWENLNLHESLRLYPTESNQFQTTYSMLN